MNRQARERDIVSLQLEEVSASSKGHLKLLTRERTNIFLTPPNGLILRFFAKIMILDSNFSETHLRMLYRYARQYKVQKLLVCASFFCNRTVGMFCQCLGNIRVRAIEIEVANSSTADIDRILASVLGISDITWKGYGFEDTHLLLCQAQSINISGYHRLTPKGIMKFVEQWLSGERNLRNLTIFFSKSLRKRPMMESLMESYNLDITERNDL